MSKNMLILILSLGVLTAGAVVGLSVLQEQGTPPESSGMKKFASREELAAYLDRNAYEDWESLRVGSTGQGGGTFTSAEKAYPDMSPIPAATGIVTGASHSTTNIQVQGVDEADFVKNDARYIYIVSDGELVIVEATPAADAGIISRTRLEGQPSEIFLKGDVLVVLSSGQKEVMVHPASSVAPVPYWRPATAITLYDVSDRKNPKVSREVTVTGNYYDSRLIGDDMYVVTSQNAEVYRGVPVLPAVDEPGAPAVVPDIYL